jgi:SAM-dependent methyltransferase
MAPRIPVSGRKIAPALRPKSTAAETATPGAPTAAKEPLRLRQTSGDRAEAREPFRERAGAREPYRDPWLYDWEYRRRTRDVAFYRMLADEQGGPIADLGCGSGRMLVPLARDGHRVVGVDLSGAMLRRAKQRLVRAGRLAAARAVLVRGDLRALPLGPTLGGGGRARHGGRFRFMLCAFHTIQHLVEDADLLGLFLQVRRLLTPTGWFAFDVFVPHPDWLNQPAHRRFDHIIYRDPVTRARTEYSVSHVLDRARKALHMRFHYRSLDPGAGRASGQGRGRGRGRGGGATRTVRLCHRQLDPGTVEALAAAAGLRTLSRWASFEGLALDPANPHLTEQHIYLLGPESPGRSRSKTRAPTGDS